MPIVSANVVSSGQLQNEMTDNPEPRNELSRAASVDAARAGTVASATPPPPPRVYAFRTMILRGLRKSSSIATMLLVAALMAFSMIANGTSFAAQVHASSNSAPTFGSTSYSFNLAENADGSTTAVSVGTVAATDSDTGDTLTYSLSGDFVGYSCSYSSGNSRNCTPATDNKFAINSSTGAITYKGSGENYEGIDSFTLEAQVTDGKVVNPVSVPVTVTVTNVAETPKFVPHRVVSSKDTYDFALENGQDGSGTAISIGKVRYDDEDEDTLTFAITEGDTDSKFEVSSTGDITYTGSGEASGTFALTVTMKDSSSDTTADDTAYVNVTVATAATDRAALIALYNATGGDNWTDGSKTETTGAWKIDDSTSDMADWHGVTMQNGRVHQVSLYNNNLRGELPYQLGNLTQMSSLQAYYNVDEIPIFKGDLKGNLPPSLGNLTNLSELLLYGNKHTGAIPAEIGKLTNLKHFSLQRNKLTGTIPSTVVNMTSLQTLNLGSNSLTGPIPSQIGKLTALTNLGLNRNRLTGAIPSDISKLTKLTILSLGHNRLTGSIPSGINKLTKLKELSLEENNLTGSIPAGIGSLTSLEQLHLNNNELTGAIPTQIGSLAKLVVANFDSNELSGNVPSTFGDKMTALGRLDVSDNLKMTKVLPTELMTIPKMKTLIFSNTDLCASTKADFVYWLESLESYDGDYCEIPMTIETAPSTVREDDGIVKMTVKAILDSFLGVVVRTVIEWPQGQGDNPAEEGSAKDYEVIETPVPLVIPAEGTPESTVTFKIQMHYDSHWEPMERILLSASKEKTVLFVPTPTPESGGSNAQSNANIKELHVTPAPTPGIVSLRNVPTQTPTPVAKPS